MDFQLEGGVHRTPRLLVSYIREKLMLKHCWVSYVKIYVFASDVVCSVVIYRVREIYFPVTEHPSWPTHPHLSMQMIIFNVCTCMMSMKRLLMETGGVVFFRANQNDLWFPDSIIRLWNRSLSAGSERGDFSEHGQDDMATILPIETSERSFVAIFGPQGKGGDFIQAEGKKRQAGQRFVTK